MYVILLNHVYSILYFQEGNVKPSKEYGLLDPVMLRISPSSSQPIILVSDTNHSVCF